ncbi:hypothetical protein PFICI_11794 [Pestalotiopsis fici W106-1]|uniref:T6SS Phospholipase effector Tle1-like catalytic domain-containing protein n=1 Tax=Pestalotiopsis fici (strain W106-1 / CGMCC3.15140) TaxID=1229662 RepID=W3WTC9_PESFW|nr:uncharacterized protein PFICI_11794 [Pestalotiopsis fici W106-1]ETS76407.1 hypothetical protein PFICI_11794 [Pestalotiopsis fici W106-1]
MSSSVRKRVIACVDGTWFNEDGQEDRGQGNNSNVFRVESSIQQGMVTDVDGRQIEQITRYYPGIGVGVSPFEKINEGILGRSCEKLIDEVYDFCVDNIETSNDEVWLFGFSRGAFIVRAVAKLLCNGVIPRSKGPQIKSVFKKLGSDPGSHNSGQRQNIVRNHGKPFPRIRFLGLFDTVKRALGLKDFPIVDENRIETVRHVMALNEHRLARYPVKAKDDTQYIDPSRSIIEAWFIGSHQDIGGGALHDGLSLYPLQWILHEARANGLVLGHGPKEPHDIISDPLQLVLPGQFPSVPVSGPLNNKGAPWRFRYSNQLEVSMYDIRAVHGVVDLKTQKQKLTKRSAPPSLATHNVRLNAGALDSLKLGDRGVFGERLGKLNGYNPDSRSGTIVHPSVYLLVESYCTPHLASSLEGLQHHLESFREEAMLRALAPDGIALLDVYPWIRDFNPTMATPTCRILICGGAGVGKSTILNRVFGMSLTGISSMERGAHDVENGYQDAQHPGVIIHDSEGFQQGGKQEVKALTKFLERRSGSVDMREKLQAIWLCIPADDERPVQEGMANVLKEVARITPATPVIVVCTKKDKLLMSKTNRFSYDDIDAICRNDLLPDDKLLRREREILERRQERIELAITKDILTKDAWHLLQNKRFQCVLGGEVPSDSSENAQYDARSITELIQKTAELIEDGLAADGMIAAQIQDLDIKIDRAVEKTLQFLRKAMFTSTSAGVLVVANAVGTPTIARLLCSEIVTGCYGIPKHMAAKAEGLLARIVGKNSALFIGQSIVQNVALLGVGSIFLEAATAARVVLKCACDLILILDRAFRLEGRAKFVGYDKISAVALSYVTRGRGKEKSRRSQVHAAINNLIPLLSTRLVASHFGASILKYRLEIKDILIKYRLEEGDYSTPRYSVSEYEDKLSLMASIEEDQEDEKELSKGL